MLKKKVRLLCFGDPHDQFYLTEGAGAFCNIVPAHPLTQNQKQSKMQSAISHQLKALKNARLVKSRRDGKTVFYSLADDHVKTIIDQGLEHILE